MPIAENLLLVNVSCEITNDMHDIGSNCSVPCRQDTRIHAEFAAESHESAQAMMDIMRVGYGRVAVASQEDAGYIAQEQKNFDRDMEAMSKEALANVHETGVAIVAQNEALLKRVAELEEELRSYKMYHRSIVNNTGGPLTINVQGQPVGSAQKI